MPPNSTDTDPPPLSLSSWHQARRFVGSKLTWNRVYRATSYLKSALWTVPFVAIVLDIPTVGLYPTIPTDGRYVTPF